MSTKASREATELARWQQRLLPFVMLAIIAMGIFFFASSLIQLGRFSDSVAYRADDRIDQSIAAFEKKNPELAATVDELHWKTVVALEQSVIRQRYAQVNATMMLRAWTRHLGFLTGMILALVGATFILAKLSEKETSLSIEGSGAKGALETSSPGIVLAVLGTILMVVTLTASFSFETRDVPVYLTPGEVQPQAGLPPPDAPPPPAGAGDSIQPSQEGQSDANHSAQH